MLIKCLPKTIVMKIMCDLTLVASYSDEDEVIRGRLHLSDSVYESPYDSVHDLYTKG
jgi:hypothetical protein